MAGWPPGCGISITMSFLVVIKSQKLKWVHIVSHLLWCHLVNSF